MPTLDVGQGSAESVFSCEPRFFKTLMRLRRDADAVVKEFRRHVSFPELGAAASQLRVLREELESTDDDVDDSVGPFRASVGSYMQPELQKILLGQL